MPAKSEKQARLFRLVRGVQTGNIPLKKVSTKVRKMAKDIKPSDVKDFTKLKEILKNLKENEYSMSKMREVPNQSLKQVLSQNGGVPFDKKELLSFQNKQNGFGGMGRVNFVHKKSTNELSANVFNNGTSKTYVFKKLKNNENPGLYNYGCFVGIVGSDADDDKSVENVAYALSSIFDNKDEVKTKVLSDFIDRINAYGL